MALLIPGKLNPDGPAGNSRFFALAALAPPAFFTGEQALTRGGDYLQFPNTGFFGYYAFLSDPHYVLGYEYVIDAKDD